MREKTLHIFAIQTRFWYYDGIERRRTVSKRGNCEISHKVSCTFAEVKASNWKISCLSDSLLVELMFDFRREVLPSRICANIPFLNEKEGTNEDRIVVADQAAADRDLNVNDANTW